MIMWRFWLFVLALVAAAAFFITRYRQGIRAGTKLRPLNGEDRLRLILAVRAFEDAERELAKAAWVDNVPGHPVMGELLLDVKELQAKARIALRGGI